MPLLGAKEVCKTFGDREILSSVSLTIDEGQRWGIVGSNGSGKTTFARILAGVEAPDKGEVVRTKGMTLAYLSQEPKMEATQTALEVSLSSLEQWSQAMASYEKISQQIADTNNPSDGLVEGLSQAAMEIEDAGGWDMSHKAEAMLGYLGIQKTNQVVGTMSGGERRRVAMARAFLSNPDLVILDEPTNHLDIPTIQWLEQFLTTRYKGALLLITHDRFLLNKVCHKTIEVDRGSIFVYDGGWENYLEKKAERKLHDEKVEANRRNFLRRELEWLSRQPKARTTKSKARTGRAHQAMAAKKEQSSKIAAFAVDKVRQGKTILDIRDVCVDIAERRLVKNLTMSLAKGDRVGIIGRNGVGKTSLLRVLLGENPPSQGDVHMGKNTKIAYLDQSRSDVKESDTVYNAVADGQTHISFGGQTIEVRTYLLRFLFTVPAQAKQVRALSGGERARLALARVLRNTANLIVLDEPTNDLDVDTLSALESSLLDSGSSALLVTHDRWFLDRVVTHILSFEGDGKVLYLPGNYSDYVAWKERHGENTSPAKETTTKSKKKVSAGKPKKLTFGEKIELEGLLEKIANAEADVAQIEASVASDAFAHKDYQQQAEVLEKMSEAKSQVESLVERWTYLEEKSEASRTK